MLPLLVHDGKIIPGKLPCGSRLQLQVYTRMVVRRAPTLQMNSSIVVVVQDAKSNLQMFVWTLLQRDSITKARSALSRFRMCRSV